MGDYSLPMWVTLWMGIASLLVTLDCIYVLSIENNVTNLVPSALLEWWGWYGESDSQYSVTGKGIEQSSGWMQTQSKFNVLELLLQLYFLGMRWGTPKRVLVGLIVSCFTLWKTLMYMSIIAHSADPVNMVPLLHCAGFDALPANSAQVQAALAKDNCGAQFFKFQFNFWWIVMPFLVIRAACNILAKAHEVASNPAWDKKSK